MIYSTLSPEAPVKEPHEHPIPQNNQKQMGSLVLAAPARMTPYWNVGTGTLCRSFRLLDVEPWRSCLSGLCTVATGAVAVDAETGINRDETLRGVYRCQFTLAKDSWGRYFFITVKVTAGDVIYFYRRWRWLRQGTQNRRKLNPGSKLKLKKLPQNHHFLLRILRWKCRNLKHRLPQHAW